MLVEQQDAHRPHRHDVVVVLLLASGERRDRGLQARTAVAAHHHDLAQVGLGHPEHELGALVAAALAHLGVGRVVEDEFLGTHAGGFGLGEYLRDGLGAFGVERAERVGGAQLGHPAQAEHELHQVLLRPRFRAGPDGADLDAALELLAEVPGQTQPLADGQVLLVGEVPPQHDQTLVRVGGLEQALHGLGTEQGFENLRHCGPSLGFCCDCASPQMTRDSEQNFSSE